MSVALWILVGCAILGVVAIFASAIADGRKVSKKGQDAQSELKKIKDELVKRFKIQWQPDIRDLVFLYDKGAGGSQMNGILLVIAVTKLKEVSRLLSLSEGEATGVKEALVDEALRLMEDARGNIRAASGI